MKEQKIEPKGRVLRKPSWLKVGLGGGDTYAGVDRVLRHEGLHTICQSGRCPNQGECWHEGTATFMLLGDVCTRACRFCATRTGRPHAPNPHEAKRLLSAVRLMKLRHVVLTSVDRDDLPDGGASHWRNVVALLRKECPSVTVEVLLPDFKAKEGALEVALSARPHLAAHNLETVQRLTRNVRGLADYETSLSVLARITQQGIISKTGLMLGLGETHEEVLEALSDARKAGVSLVTLGQYLQPRRENWPVDRYVTPEEFETLRHEALAMGFRYVEAGPLVRSSFHSSRALQACGIQPDTPPCHE